MAAKIESQSGSYSFRRLKPESKYLHAVQSQIKAVDSSQNKKLEDIAVQKDRSCRLLFHENQLVGFIIYKREPRTIKTWENSFKIELFVSTPKASEKDRVELLNRAVILAKDRQAAFIDIKVPNTQNALLNFLLEHAFSKIKTYAKSKKTVQNLLIRTLNSDAHNSAVNTKQVESTPKRKRETPAEDLPHNKRAREDQSSSVQSFMPSFKRRQRVSSADHRQHLPSERYPAQRSYGSEERDYSSHYPPTEWQSYKGNPVERNQRPYSQPKHHELTLRKMYIHQIRSGRKTVEGRINSGMIRNYRQGDTIRFFYKQNQSDDVVCKITDIRIFDTFRDMLIDSGFKQCVSETYSLDQAENIYLNIPGYADRAAQHGVVALHLEVIRNGYRS